MDNIRLKTTDVRGLVRCRKIVTEVGNRPGEGMLLANPVVADEESYVVHGQLGGGSTRERE